MTALLLLLLSLPCAWTQAIESRAVLEAAGIKLCNESELASREPLPTPGIVARAGVASPTRSPWIVANGWRFMRHPGRKYVYDVPAGKAALAAAEAFAYGADAVVKVDPADVGNLGTMITFLEEVPAVDLPVIADLAVVEDGSAVTGEVMNLLARRNLLFHVVQTPSPQVRINITMGAAGYPVEDAADPNAFALKIRRQLTDEQRSLRIYGSEVVICRLTGDASRARLHLINYGGREIEGLRVRLRGSYRSGEAHIAGTGRLPLQDHIVADGFTEFSLPRLAAYAAIDLEAGR
jgi:hypothetical protein